MHAGDLLDRLGQQLGATERIRRVDLVAAVSGDGDVGVPGDRDHRGLAAVAGDVDEDDRVGALALGRAAAVERLLLLRGEPLAAVRPDEQVVVAALVDRPVAGRVVVHPGDAVPGVERHPDEERHPEDDDDEDRDEDVAPGTSRTRRRGRHGCASRRSRRGSAAGLPGRLPAGLQRRQGTATRGAAAERAPRVDDIAGRAVVDGADVVSLGHSDPWSHAPLFETEFSDVPRPQAYRVCVVPGPRRVDRPRRLESGPWTRWSPARPPRSRASPTG